MAGSLETSPPPPGPPTPTGTPDPLYPEPDDCLFTPADWKEMIEVRRPGGEDIYSADGEAEACLVGMIPAKKFRSFRTFALGYAWADLVSPYRLHRKLPMQHPDDPLLYASAVAGRPFNPVGRDVTPIGAEVKSFQANRPSLASVSFPDKLANYTYTEVLVKFHCPHYELIADSDSGGAASDESLRFCTRFASEPRLDTLNADGQKVVFSEGPADNPKGKEFPGTLQLYVHTTALRLRWMFVPAAYIEKNGVCERIEACVGTINSEFFMGHYAGKLVCEPPRLTPFVFPVRTASGAKLYGYHVDLEFKFTDPEPAVGRDNALAFGWDLYPWPTGAPETSSAKGGPGWYAANRTGATDGPDFIEHTDFNSIFRSVLNPAD